jgi:uncharacterized protein (TIGR02118 family)
MEGNRVIKTLALLRKADTIGHEDFVDLWSQATRARLADDGVARCVRYLVHPPPPSPPGSPPLAIQVDGAEEWWFNDETSLDRFRNAPAQRTFLTEAIGAMTHVVFDEATIVDELPPGATGDGMLKRLVVLVRKSGFTHEAFTRHWIEVHAPLAREVSGGARKYCQLYVTRQLANPPGLSTHGIEIDGFSESWFDDAAHLGRSLDVPGGAALARDNRVYVETSKLVFFSENEVKPYAPAPAGALC